MSDTTVGRITMGPSGTYVDRRAEVDAFIEAKRKAEAARKHGDMTEARARELLGEGRCHVFIEDGSDNLIHNFRDKGRRHSWRSITDEGVPSPICCMVNEPFTADELRAIAFWMDNKGGE